MGVVAVVAFVASMLAVEIFYFCVCVPVCVCFPYCGESRLRRCSLARLQDYRRLGLFDTYKTAPELRFLFILFFTLLYSGICSIQILPAEKR